MALDFLQSHLPLFVEEIKRWQRTNTPITLWWRDDDAAKCSSALGTLLDIHHRYAIPLTLAVIPLQLQTDAIDLVLRYPNVEIIQHGINHENHAVGRQKKLELGGTLSTQQAMDGLEKGATILRSCFGERFVPVLVPPWNRIRQDIAEQINTIGLVGLSEHQRRKPSPTLPQLIQNNTHCDPVRWHRKKDKVLHPFVGWPKMDRFLSWHLSARRRGRCRISEATGLLTHHGVHDKQSWYFLETFLSETQNVPVLVWQRASTLFINNPWING